jgi:hypothetical protein
MNVGDSIGKAGIVKWQGVRGTSPVPPLRLPCAPAQDNVDQRSADIF